MFPRVNRCKIPVIYWMTLITIHIEKKTSIDDGKYLYFYFCVTLNINFGGWEYFYITIKINVS